MPCIALKNPNDQNSLKFLILDKNGAIDRHHIHETGSLKLISILPFLKRNNFEGINSM